MANINGVSMQISSEPWETSISIYLSPKGSDKRSIHWVEHHFPLRKLKKYLISSRRRMGLTMDDINKACAKLRAGNFRGYTWGSPGNIQMYIYYNE